MAHGPPDGCRASRRAWWSSASASAWRSARPYWDLDGTFAARERVVPGHARRARRARLATSRDFDPATGRSRRAGAVHCSRRSGARARVPARHVGYTVASAESKPFTERPKAPFKTTTMQQEAGNKLRFSAARTMSVAQGLYERGYITYMRTDSVKLSEQAVDAARDQILERVRPGVPARPPRDVPQQGEERAGGPRGDPPAGDALPHADEVARELSGDEQSLYELIWMRTVASQMADARIRSVTLRLAATSSAASRRCSGRRVARSSSPASACVRGRREEPDASRGRRGEPPAGRRGRGRRLPGSSARRATRRSRPPATPRRAWSRSSRTVRSAGRRRTPRSSTPYQRARLRLEEGERTRPVVDRVREDAAARALLPPPRRLRLHRHHGGGARRDRGGEGEAEKWLHSFYFGNGTAGLHELVSEEHLAKIDMTEVNAVHIGGDGDGRPRSWSGSGTPAPVERGDEKSARCRRTWPPTSSPSSGPRSSSRSAAGPRELGVDPETGQKVLALNGRFGPFVQLGELEEGSKEKPKRASLFKSMDPESVTLEHALALLSLPRVVGQDAEGDEITAQNGRYGPYLKKGTDSRSLESESADLHITLEGGEAIFAQPKQRRGAGGEAADRRARPQPGTGSTGAGARRPLRPVRHRRHHQRHRPPRPRPRT